jgi:hypothetical protein
MNFSYSIAGGGNNLLSFRADVPVRLGPRIRRAGGPTVGLRGRDHDFGGVTKRVSVSGERESNLTYGA